jgi:hypothetical protein
VTFIRITAPSQGVDQKTLSCVDASSNISEFLSFFQDAFETVNLPAGSFCQSFADERRPVVGFGSKVSDKASTGVWEGQA